MYSHYNGHMKASQPFDNEYVSSRVEKFSVKLYVNVFILCILCFFNVKLICMVPIKLTLSKCFGSNQNR